LERFAQALVAENDRMETPSRSDRPKMPAPYRTAGGESMDTDPERVAAISRCSTRGETTGLDRGLISTVISAQAGLQGFGDGSAEEVLARALFAAPVVQGRLAVHWIHACAGMTGCWGG